MYCIFNLPSGGQGLIEDTFVSRFFTWIYGCHVCIYCPEVFDFELLLFIKAVLIREASVEL